MLLNASPGTSFNDSFSLLAGVKQSDYIGNEGHVRIRSLIIIS